MESMGSEQSQQSPQKSFVELASPTETTEKNVAIKQGVESSSSHASPSTSTSSGASPASGGGGSSHHSSANIIGASPTGGSTSSCAFPATGGASHHTPATGGACHYSATKHLDSPKTAGKSKKSCSIAKLKLATQVGVDSSGAIRKDFPFKNITSRNELKVLTHNTLFSTVPPKKRKIKDWVAKQMSAESLTTSGDVSFVFSKTYHNTYSYVGETEKSQDVSTTDLENSSLVVNVSSNGDDKMTNLGDGDGNDETSVGDGTQMTSMVDGADHTYASHGDKTTNYLSDGDNEASASDGEEPRNLGDVAEDNNITNKSTIGSGELFSVASEDTIPETPPE